MLHSDLALFHAPGKREVSSFFLQTVCVKETMIRTMKVKAITTIKKIDLNI